MFISYKDMSVFALHFAVGYVLSRYSFFVYSSSISVYGDRLQNPNIKVTDSLLPSQGDEYAAVRLKLNGKLPRGTRIGQLPVQQFAASWQPREIDEDLHVHQFD